MATEFSEMEQLNELALFAGAGGGILGGKLLGWRTVCAVEFNAYAASVLLQRQNDGCLPPFPVWDDVRTFDGRSWRGIVDVVSGGFPCQDISAAGKGAGITGERSGLWKEFARIICEVGPRYVFVENSPLLTSRGLDTVLGDLAALGFDAEWGVLGAVDVGAPHKRDRVWIMADASQQGRDTRGLGERTTARQPEPFDSRQDTANVADAMQERRNGRAEHQREHAGSTPKCSWWATEPDLGRVAHGVAARVDRLTAIGNGQVPLVAATAWKVLLG